MRIVVFGMVGPFAGPALTALLEAGVDVIGVAIPAPPGAPPVAAPPRIITPPGSIILGPQRPPSLLELAAAQNIPALALRGMAVPAVRDALAALRPDLFVVACWPWRLPPTLLAIPRLGALNLHPSPLPALRGPEPLFWALQEGRECTAVTLHWMDEGLDTGPIALQRSLDLPIGIGWGELEARAATLGAELLAEATPLLAHSALPRVPQPPGGSFRPMPGDADFALARSWSATHAFRFMRGTSAWGRPYTIDIGAITLKLGAAIAYAPQGALGAAYTITGNTVHIQLSPGLIETTLAP